MKPPKNRLSLMIALSVALCLIVTVLSVVLLHAADDSMLQEKNGYPDYSFCKDYLSGHPDIYKPMPDEAR